MVERIQRGSETHYLSYISSPDALVAMHISDDDGRDEMKYVLTDYLGTIYALVDDGAQSTDDALYYSFNAWGERRELQAYDGSLTAPLFSDPADYITSRGYTGHEHIDAFDLINMNGRAYDPLVGAFLSPDPYVQAPDMPQNLNRYAYCLNNPLKYSDPSGEFIIPMLIGAAIGITTNGISNLANNKSFFDGAFKSALLGGIGGGLSFGIGQLANQITGFGRVAFQTLSHGTLGGLMSDASGGDFSSGFLSGAFGSLAATGTGSLLSGTENKFTQAFGTTASGALARGVGAEIAGGKFWDGARNGAISAGLNHGIHAGFFGRGLMMASITGRTRHLISGDAVAGTISANGSAGLNVGVEAGGVKILQGKHAGETVPLTDVSVGVGGLEVTLTAELMDLYYSGPLKKLTPEVFTGPRFEMNVGFANILALGITAVYAPMRDNEYVVGYGFGVGIGVSPIGFFNVNYGVTGKNPKDIHKIISDMRK